jgi:hypothetical protein
MTRSPLASLLVVLALGAAACGGAGATDTTAIDSTSTTVTRPATTTGRPGTSETLAGSETIRAQIDELMVEAQQVRGLEFKEPVDVVLLNDEDYQNRLREVFDEDLAQEDVDAINAYLRMLGVIEADEDFRVLLETLYTAGTGGFYRPETGELVVRVVGEELGPYSESTVLHELVHALQDQNFELLDDLEDLEGDDAFVAQAIIEGDARLREFTFVQSMSRSQQAAYLEEIGGLLATLDTAALDALPAYIRNSFQALYDDGFAFLQQVGLDKVDQQLIDPPESSEQLLEATKYRRDEQPREVVLPDLDLAGYDIWFDTTAGQKDLQLLLEEGVDISRARQAAEGWGGDANRIYTAGDEDAVFVFRFVGDTKADAEQLEAAFTEFVDVMVSSDAYTLVERDADQVLVIVASDRSLGPQLAAAFS